MVVFPNCKINLGLNIIAKRHDGFHDLETVFYPVPLKDALEIIIPEQDLSTPVEFTMSGHAVDGNADDNICFKAYHLLKKEFPHIAGIKMHLHKAIPMGAGLGGGSADGAFTLKLLDKLFELNLSDEQLIHFALQLGSDCPFFIFNKPCFASGRGEIMNPVTIDLSSYKIILVNPGIHVNTGWAFSQINPTVPGISLSSTISQPIENWQELIKNDFEEPVFKHHPEIKSIKETLQAAGAVYSSMSGSGSTVFGFFKKETNTSFAFPSGYFIKELTC